MKTIKPQKLGVMSRVFENGREFYFVITVMVFFPLDAPTVLLSEQALWKTVMPELGPDVPLDAGMPKPMGELLVAGKAYPRGGVPRPAVSVRAQVGPVDKTLYVVGDRIWHFGGPGEPVPFTEMPITWARSFGGEGFAKNPLGKGVKPIRGEDGKERHPMPNIENPKELMKSPNDRPSPAGLSAYDFMWPQRFSKIGTYDDEWLKTRYPGFAKDMDLGLFSTAPEDQRLAKGAFFEGTEAFRLENLHPSLPVIEGRLPGVKARAFITHKPEDGEQELREATMRLDTVHFFPHLMRGLLFYRGMLRIEEDDAYDVVHMLLGAEKMGEPKPLEHYTTVLEQRLDRKRGHLFALRDSDLLPPVDKSAIRAPEKDELQDLIATEGLLKANLDRKAAADREKAAATIRSMGANPDDYMKMPEMPEAEQPPDDLEAMPEFVMRQEELAEKLKATAEKKQAENKEIARKLCEENGFDYDKLMAEGKKKGGGPPRFDVQKEIEKTKVDLAKARAAGSPLPELEAMVNNPAFAERLKDAHDKLILGYRKFAHHFPAATALDGDPAARLREEVEAALRRGESLAERDMTGADLHGLCFDGVNLRGAFMEATNLRGASFKGADLTDIVMARADLSGADLSGAKLEGSNFGEAKLEGANLSGATLVQSVLYRARLKGASFRDATLDQADLGEAVFEDNDMAGVKARRLMLLYTDLKGIRCAGAELFECMFIETLLEGADFSGARVTKSVFVAARGDGVSFRDADADNLRIVHGSTFARADFRGAKIGSSTLRGTNFAGADFTGARMDGSDLSECCLEEAKFGGISGRQARFIRADLRGARFDGADLMSSMFQNARVDRAVFRDASLFRADFARVRGEHTDFSGANVKVVRTVPRGSHGQG